MSLSCRTLAALVIGLAFGLAAESVAVHGHNRTALGNTCAQTADNPDGLCFQDQLSGGWPFPYLQDAVGTSVLGKLGPEDDFTPEWFFMDAAVFGAVIAIGPLVLRLRRRRPDSS